MRRPALLALALSVSAVAAVACTKKKSTTPAVPFGAGEYTLSAWTGTSDCGFVSESTLDGDTIEVYGTGATLQLGATDPGIPITLAGTAITSSVHTPESFEFSNDIFCILDDQTTITGQVNSANRAVITVTDTYNPGSLNVNNQCQWTAGSTPTTYPCVATQTFTLTRTGVDNPATPNPAVPEETGTITASSDSAGLTGVFTALSSGLTLDFSATLGTSVSTESAVDPWFCTAPNSTFSPNYVIFNAVGNDTAFFTTFTMLVATNAWSVGSHPITPQTVFLAVGSSTLDFAASAGSAGNLVLASAGTVADSPGNACKFSLNGVTATGVVVPEPGPVSAASARGFTHLLHPRRAK